MTGAYRNNELIAGAGGPQATGRGTVDDRRWLPVRNTTKETIPPYALMALYASAREDGATYQPYETGEQQDYSSQEVRDGQVVWLAKKPGTQDEAMQQAAMLMVNSAAEIAPGQYGLGTQDWPAPCLFDAGSGSSGGNYYSTGGSAGGAAEDGYAFGPCGPRAGSWKLHGSGNAFLNISPDETEAPSSSEILRWIGPNRPGRQRWIADFSSRTFSLDVGESLGLLIPHLTNLLIVSPGQGGISSQSQLILDSTAAGAGGGDIRFKRDARVLISLSMHVQVGGSAKINTDPASYPIEIQPAMKSSTGVDPFEIAVGDSGLHPMQFFSRQVVDFLPPHSQIGVVLPAGDVSRTVHGYYDAKKGDTLSLKITAGTGHNDIRGRVSAMAQIDELW